MRAWIVVFLSLMSVLSMSALGHAQSLDGDTAARVEAILQDYETIRASLAADRGRPVAAAARSIRTNAEEASAGASGGARNLLRALASKARALAGVSAADMDALRLAFGRLSQPLITLVRGSTRLRRGRHLFECPMAEGYGGWIQNEEQISNPYMGQRMLTCGAGRDW